MTVCYCTFLITNNVINPVLDSVCNKTVFCLQALKILVLVCCRGTDTIQGCRRIQISQGQDQMNQFLVGLNFDISALSMTSDEQDCSKYPFCNILLWKDRRTLYLYNISEAVLNTCQIWRIYTIVKQYTRFVYS